ncbi:hypothetical protein Glove_216g14 [Diversispora epigaea]|uniref:Uncharacterized protein n=1 Tax=Diversispora epigaea TaxID=1348612 RepID=A0A397IH93_9GLOM|nr:hypothetical protein Glove_216g14 [Diversispora epigaea]
MGCRLPYLISKITIKEYNNFLGRQESSGYKYQRNNNFDVYIIDMSVEEHDSVVELIQRYFNAPNNNIIVDPPIEVSGDRFHFSPFGMGELIAPDVSIYPNENYVQQPRIPYPGPPPGSKKGKVHARIIIMDESKYREWAFGTLTTFLLRVMHLTSLYLELISRLHKYSESADEKDEYVPRVPLAITAVNFSIDLYQIQQKVLSMQDND